MSESRPVAAAKVRVSSELWRLARRLRPLLAVAIWAAGAAALAGTSCIFPDFNIVPEENLPLSFDLSVFEPPSSLAAPDEPHTLDHCVDNKLRLELDPRTALQNPDGDLVFWFWIVNDRQRPTGFPDVVGFDASAPYVDAFVFDACNNANQLKAGETNTIKLVVRDRAPSGDTVQDVKSIGPNDDPDTSITTLVWMVDVVSITCCVPPQ